MAERGTSRKGERARRNAARHEGKAAGLRRVAAHGPSNRLAMSHIAGQDRRRAARCALP